MMLEPEAYRSPRTDGLAIAALVTGMLSIAGSIVVVGVLLGPAAAIMGFIAHERVVSSAGTRRGGGIAIAGLILGVIGFTASVVLPGVLLLDAHQSGGSLQAP
jgi:hypothetical protein